jgi:cyclase
VIPPRLIPVLLIDRDRRVVKTVGFGERTYIGDPFNILRLFNEKEVDEICVLDIDASADGRGPDLDFALALASECFMPLAYGGGLRTLEQARRLARGGIEKFVLRSHATPALLATLAQEFGAQAVVGCIDYQRAADGALSVTANPGFASQGGSPARIADAMVAAGAGEIILQSIDLDGARTGMDLDAIAACAGPLSAPVIALGGAGTVEHMHAAIGAGAAAAASGSAFSFIGPLRAVLITYPDYATRVPEAAP